MHKPAQVELQLDLPQLPYLEILGLIIAGGSPIHYRRRQPNPTKKRPLQMLKLIKWLFEMLFLNTLKGMLLLCFGCWFWGILGLKDLKWRRLGLKGCDGSWSTQTFYSSYLGCQWLSKTIILLWNLVVYNYYESMYDSDYIFSEVWLKMHGTNLNATLSTLVTLILFLVRSFVLYFVG